MSILSSIKSAAKKAVSVVKKVGSAIGSALTSGGKSNLANASSALPAANQSLVPKTSNQTLAPNFTTPQGIGQRQSDGSVILLDKKGQPTGSVISPGGVGSTPLPSNPASPYYAPDTLGGNRGGGASPYSSTLPTGSPSLLSASFDISPRMAADSLTSGASLPSVGVGDGGAATSPTNALPGTPGYANPGPANLAGTASALTGMYALNPATGLLEPVTEETLAKERETTAKDIARRIPQKENILQDEEVQRQQAEVDQRKQEVAGYTASLNAIVAKQNADLLHLQDVGSKEGVTEAVYGGQQAEINREAAIKALPIQAQIAAAQGNLQLAQEHLTDLVKIKTEAVDNAYTYKKAQFDWATQYATGEDKLKLERLNKANDRAYASQKDNIDFAQSLANKAFETGQSGIAIQLMSLIKNPGSPTFIDDLARLAKGIVPKQTTEQVQASQYKAAQKFVQDNPNATPQQLEQGIRANTRGLSEADIKSLIGGTTKLSRANVASLYGIADNNSTPGIFNVSKTNASKLDDIMASIKKYQDVGYTDDEILKLVTTK